MQSTLLLVHGLFRWMVLAVALYAVMRMAIGLATARPWTEDDRKAGAFFSIAMDVQLLLGVVLFGVSPLVRQGMSDMSAAMKDSSVRFFIAEHPVFMVLAVAFAHAGSVLAQRGPTNRAKFVRGAVGYALALALLLLGIPWWRLRAA